MMTTSRALPIVLPMALAAPAARAQTDFYNTDRGRPLSVEDAVVIERRAFELQAAPIRLERIARGVSHWRIAPELAWGLLPRTQLELSLPIAIEEDGSRERPLVALAGVDLDLMHQLNTESVALPAIALAAGVHLPAGALAPDRAVATLRALATRTLSWGRVHVMARTRPERSSHPPIPRPLNRTDGRAALATALISAGPVLRQQTLGAQWITVYEQFYLPADHNFVFRSAYPTADRLFNAFDYGHAILYERLWTRPAVAQRILEGAEYTYLTGTLLNRPPRLPLVEDAIEPQYARLAPEAKLMFEWAHILHRQVYDVLADERLSAAAKDAELVRLTAYYLSRHDLAYSTKPKIMSLMQEQPYSLAFRQGFPKFNGLIWAYHWLQVGLYEPSVVRRTSEERQAGVAATVARFRQMLPSAPEGFPVVMPMTAAVAPLFAERWPTLAIIFDNLHSMHDVISDILANPSVPRDQKRALILRAAVAYRDETTDVMSVEGWRKMTAMMGVQNQGGPSVGFMPALPTPTVARGSVMRHDKDGNMREEHHHIP